MSYDLLGGLRVIESSAFIAAPLAGLTLAQYGADVIRVDMIGGGLDYGRLPRMSGGRSLYWTGLNKAKRSLAVDLRKPEGRELVQALATAPGPNGGVLLTNIETAWLGHAVLAERRSDVISCVIQGNPDGSTALDYTVNCAAGYPAMTGSGSKEAPVNHALPAWDLACAYQAAFAVLAAATRRSRTGQGAALRIALADVAFTTLSHIGLLAEAQLLDRDRPAIGNHIYGAFGRDFACADGERVMVAAITVGQWSALVKACEAGAAVAALEQRTGLDFRDEAQRYEAREAIAQLLEPWFAARPRAAIEAELERHRVCWGRYSTVRELLAADDRVGPSNPVFESVHTQGVGIHLAAGATARIAQEERRPLGAAPLLGAHTDEVLHEVLGLDGAAIGRLHDSGIVAGPERDPSQAKQETQP